MAMMSTTSPSGLTNAQVAFVFSKKLLQYAIEELVMDQYGDSTTFEKNQGSKTIRWLRPDVGDRTKVQLLTEGVVPTTFREFGYTKIEATLSEFGEVSSFTDILSLIEIYPTLRQSISILGQDAAKAADFLVMNEIAGGAAVAGQYPAGNGINAANEIYAQGITTFANLVAASAAGGALVLTDVLRAMTRLQNARAPQINGEYVLIVPPATSFDLMQDSKFINAGLYGSSTGLFKGEVGRWYGVRVIVATQPFVEQTTKGTYVAPPTGNIYSNIVTGRNGYGVPSMSGLDQHSPRMVIVDTADHADMLNQTTTVGWKAFWTARVLNDLWIVNIRSKSTYT